MNNIAVFKNYYSSNLERLNKLIEEYNKNLLKEENRILKKNLEIFKDLNSNGKLIRGTLVNLGYRLISHGNFEYSNNLALAFELFQTSVLVHDDIIDKDDLRRGKKTIHAVNYENYSKINNSDDVRHLSNSIALCMGDYGLYLSNQCITKSYINDKNLGKVLEYFNDIVLKTIKGELIDTILPFESKNNLIDYDLEENILLVYKLKTAYYTIVGPLCLGMILSGCSNDMINDITRFGEKIGIAYQIKDDIIGIYSEETGKVVGTDIKEFKQIIMYSYIIKDEKYKNELLKYYGKDNSEDIIYKVRDIFDKSGAKDYATNMMNNLFDEGLKELDNIKWINEEDKKILYGLVEFLRKRNK